jgi:hypothetical protein
VNTAISSKPIVTPRDVAQLRFKVAGALHRIKEAAELGLADFAADLRRIADWPWQCRREWLRHRSLNIDKDNAIACAQFLCTDEEHTPYQ